MPGSIFRSGEIHGGIDPNRAGGKAAPCEDSARYFALFVGLNRRFPRRAHTLAYWTGSELAGLCQDRRLSVNGAKSLGIIFVHGQHEVRMSRGKRASWSNAESSVSRRNGARFLPGGCDRNGAAPFGFGIRRAAGTAILSRLVVTVLPPPVGGLSRSLRADSGGRRKHSRSFRR